MADVAEFCKGFSIQDKTIAQLSFNEVACLNYDQFNENLGVLRTGLNVFFLLVMGTMVYFMQAGFAMLCAGSIRQKNVKNILFKNLLDACGGALGFWTVGYAVAYGESTNQPYIGHSNFFLKDMTSGSDYIFFFFQFAFAATAATIVAGTVAERCKMVGYLFYSVMLTGFVYPVVVRQIWSSFGILSAFNDKLLFDVGMIDFAGSGVVHMTGGLTALIAAIVLGPRKGRFYDADCNKLLEPASWPAHSTALQMLGTFILWFGWYGFNPGSALAIDTKTYADVAALSAVTTTIAAASGVVSSVFTNTFLDYRATGEVEYDLSFAMNGGLGGLVAITANCCVVTPGMACIIGLLAGWVYIAFSKLLVYFRIDDAVDAIPVHFGNGMWGCIATGLFADPGKVAIAYGSPAVGLFFSAGSSHKFNLILAELCGIAFIIVWVTVVMTPYFVLLRLLGLFRVDQLEEDVGMDISHHKGAAYDLTKANDDVVDEFIEKRSQHGRGSVKAVGSVQVTKTTVSAPAVDVEKTTVTAGAAMVAEN